MAHGNEPAVSSARPAADSAIGEPVRLERGWKVRFVHCAAQLVPPALWFLAIAGARPPLLARALDGAALLLAPPAGHLPGLGGQRLCGEAGKDALSLAGMQPPWLGSIRGGHTTSLIIIWSLSARSTHTTHRLILPCSFMATSSSNHSSLRSSHPERLATCKCNGPCSTADLRCWAVSGRGPSHPVQPTLRHSQQGAQMTGMPAASSLAHALEPTRRFPSCSADYCAAFTIDRRWMGRRRLQCFGFLMM